MRDYRLLVIEFTDTQDLLPLYKWQSRHQEQLNQYHIRMIFVKSRQPKIRLYGYDGTQKWDTNRFDRIQEMFRIVETMPLSRYDKEKRSHTVYERCGLPSEKKSTRHCFHDDTHLTCCMLGGEARRYADRSGNPIGKAAEEAFYGYYGFYPSHETLTPWCTCIGSEVCSFYTKRFQDGTHIKFILNHHGDMILSAEERKHKRYNHSTPGIPYVS